MSYTEYVPDENLRDWVKCLWSIQDPPSEDIQEVWPDGCVELVFSLGNILKVEKDGSSQPYPKTFVIGLQTEILRVKSEGEVLLLGARLLPCGVRDWDQGKLDALTGQIEPCLRRGDFPSAVGLLAAWLLEQPTMENELAGALRKLYEEAGNISVAELAAAEGVSSRQIERAFAKRLGISPKMLAKVVRFAEGWSRLLSKPNLSLVELALDLGYSDQSHFSNEFKSFGRESPHAFRKKMERK